MKQDQRKRPLLVLIRTSPRPVIAINDKENDYQIFYRQNQEIKEDRKNFGSTFNYVHETQIPRVIQLKKAENNAEYAQFESRKEGLGKLFQESCVLKTRDYYFKYTTNATFKFYTNLNAINNDYLTNYTLIINNIETNKNNINNKYFNLKQIYNLVNKNYLYQFCNLKVLNNIFSFINLELPVFNAQVPPVYNDCRALAIVHPTSSSFSNNNSIESGNRKITIAHDQTNLWTSLNDLCHTSCSVKCDSVKFTSFGEQFPLHNLHTVDDFCHSTTPNSNQDDSSILTHQQLVQHDQKDLVSTPSLPLHLLHHDKTSIFHPYKNTKNHQFSTDCETFKASTSINTSLTPFNNLLNDIPYFPDHSRVIKSIFDEFFIKNRPIFKSIDFQRDLTLQNYSAPHILPASSPWHAPYSKLFDSTNSTSIIPFKNGFSITNFTPNLQKIGYENSIHYTPQQAPKLHQFSPR